MKHSQKQYKHNKFVVVTTHTITIIKITTNNDNNNNNNSHNCSYLCFYLLTQQFTFTKPNQSTKKKQASKKQKENKTRDGTKVEQSSSVKLKIKVINERRNRFVACISAFLHLNP